MSAGIRGRLTEATYKDCLLTGIFEDENRKQYEIINAKASVCEKLVGNKRLVTFYKDKDNTEQNDLGDMCLSVQLENTNPCTWKLKGADFINQEDTVIFLKEKEESCC